MKGKIDLMNSTLRHRFEIVALMIFPLYLWSGGLPQIFDYLMFVIILSYRKEKIFDLKRDKYIILLILIIAFTSMVRSIQYNDFKFLTSIAYILYNYFIYSYYLRRFRFYDKSMRKKTINYSVFSSLILLVITVVKLYSSTYKRGVGTFTNPNQLAYYSLLMNIFLIRFSEDLRLNKFLLSFGIFLNYSLTLISLSNAGIIAHSIFLFITIISILVNNFDAMVVFKILIRTLIFIVLLFLVFSYFDFSEIIYNRVFNTSSKIKSSGDVRGYSRIISNPQYLFFGAGEGRFERFNASHEFHSTLGNLLLSYGSFGLLSFLLFRLKKMKNLDSIISSFAIFLYGLSHNGIRFSMLWIVYAILDSALIRKEEV